MTLSNLSKLLDAMRDYEMAVEQRSCKVHEFADKTAVIGGTKRYVTSDSKLWHKRKYTSTPTK